MKQGRALRDLSVERQSQKNFRRYALMNKSRKRIKPELFVVLRMAHQTTATSLQVLEPGQAFLHQGLADALTLVFRQDRNRAKSVPVWSAV